MMHNSRPLPHLQFLAEKVETYDEFECARKIGCTLFQGYYFGKPVMHRTRRCRASRSPIFGDECGQQPRDRFQ